MSPTSTFFYFIVFMIVNDHPSSYKSHGNGIVLTNLCAIVCLDGPQKFTPAQEQQLVCPDPRDRPMCQHKQKQVRSSAVTRLTPVLVWKSTQSFSVCLASWHLVSYARSTSQRTLGGGIYAVVKAESIQQTFPLMY